MPDILLIQPPIRDFYLTQKRTLPYGLVCIAATLRRAGFSVGLFDGLATPKSRNIPWPDSMDFLTPFFGRFDASPFGLFHHYRHFGYAIEHIALQAKASGAFLIGISSLFTAYAGTALALAEAIKKCSPQSRIVLGGHHPTAFPEAVMDHPAVDYVIRGDGDIALPMLAAAIQDGTPLDHIPGLVHRTPDGGLSIKPPDKVGHLDGLPMPAMDLVNWKFYQRAGRASYTLAATRGCPMRCSYCAVNATTYHGFRQRSVNSVAAELVAAGRHQTLGFIDFEDEHLCARKGWMLALMERIAEHFGSKGPELRAMNGLYAPSLDDTVLRAMQRAGFKILNLALITTDKSQLDRYNRPDITDDVDRVLSLAQPLGLGCVAYLIVAGPSQAPEPSVDDLLFLAQRRLLAGVSVFYPAPGSEDFTWCRDHGLLPSRHELMRATALPLVHMTDRTQAVTLLRLGRLLNFVKRLIDTRTPLPQPARVPRRISTATDRTAVGRQLLAAFLNDGHIYGMDAEGRTYRHLVDNRLAQRFLIGIQEVTPKGTGN